jgi:hypothetical protein
VKRSPDRVLQILAPTPPIRMGAQIRTTSSRLETATILFQRTVAVLWFVEGALQWLSILTVSDSNFVSDTSPPHLAALFFFCILDFVAAVGLWLASSWGVAVWLATIVGHIVVVGVGAGVLADPVVLIASDVALVALFAALSWFGARERARA